MRPWPGTIVFSTRRGPDRGHEERRRATQPRRRFLYTLPRAGCPASPEPPVAPILDLDAGSSLANRSCLYSSGSPPALHCRIALIGVDLESMDDREGGGSVLKGRPHNPLWLL